MTAVSGVSDRSTQRPKVDRFDCFKTRWRDHGGPTRVRGGSFRATSVRVQPSDWRKIMSRSLRSEMVRWAMAGLAMSVAGLFGVALAGNSTSSPLKLTSPWVEPTASSIAQVVPTSFEVADVASLTDTFSQFDYDLAAIKGGEGDVPRLFLSALPEDLSEASVAVRKSLFIQAILPLILRTNEVILGERRRLLAIVARRAAVGEIDAGDQAWLAELAAIYDVAPHDIEALIERVDIVPPSLALAQAAEESGWGTSRFAREGNAVFGERTFTAGRGLVPERRDADKSHEVRVFDGLHFSVATYMLNLNTHWAYDHFRRARANMRARNEDLDGAELAGTMRQYSERGADYIDAIRSIIRVNGLIDLDDVSLVLMLRGPGAEG